MTNLATSSQLASQKHMNILVGIIPWEPDNQNQGRSRKQYRGLKADRQGRVGTEQEQSEQTSRSTEPEPEPEPEPERP